MSDCGHLFKVRASAVGDGVEVSVCMLCGSPITAEQRQQLCALDNPVGIWAPAVSPAEPIPFGNISEVAAAADASVDSGVDSPSTPEV